MFVVKLSGIQNMLGLQAHLIFFLFLNKLIFEFFWSFRGEDSDGGIQEHGRLHFQQDYISNFYFKKVNNPEIYYLRVDYIKLGI